MAGCWAAPQWCDELHAAAQTPAGNNTHPMRREIIKMNMSVLFREDYKDSYKDMKLNIMVSVWVSSQVSTKLSKTSQKTGYAKQP